MRSRIIVSALMVLGLLFTGVVPAASNEPPVPNAVAAYEPPQTYVDRQQQCRAYTITLPPKKKYLFVQDTWGRTYKTINMDATESGFHKVEIRKRGYKEELVYTSFNPHPKTLKLDSAFSYRITGSWQNGRTECYINV